MSKLEEEIISHVMDITFKSERIIQDTHEGFSLFKVCLEKEMGGRKWEGGVGGGERLCCTLCLLFRQQPWVF